MYEEKGANQNLLQQRFLDLEKWILELHEVQTVAQLSLLLT